MFEFITGTVAGGWNAVSNIVGGVGKAAGSLFTGNTKVPIQSNIMQSSTGITGIARSVEPQASAFSWSSMLGTASKSAAVPSSISPITAAGKSSFWSDVFSPWTTAVSDLSLGNVVKQTSGGLAQGIIGSAGNIGGQLSDIILQKIGLKAKTEPANSQGATTTNYPTAVMQPATTPAAGPQMPGSFNIGFPQTWPISTGQAAAGGTGIALIAVAIGAIILLLARKR